MNLLKLNIDKKLYKNIEKVKCLKCNGIGLIKRETLFKCENCLYNTAIKCYKCENANKSIWIECIECFGSGEIENNKNFKENKFKSNTINGTCGTSL